MDATALLAHILSQTRQNVDFLVAQKQISQTAANEILAKLPKAKPSSSVDELVRNTQNVAISSPAPSAVARTNTSPWPPADNHQGFYHEPPSVPSAPSSAPTLPPGVIFRAKALWDYNERGENPADLSFRGGDTIDVMAETNADWWTGRANGKHGLFPANYVERLASAPGAGAHPPAPQAVYSPPSANTPPYSVAPSYSSYSPPPGPSYVPPHAYASPSGYAPPPSGGYAPTYAGPPPPGQAYSPYASQPGPGYPPPGSSEYNKEGNGNTGPGKDSEKKKSKMGDLGGTLATAAVGGVGFGAGTAIGSGIIDSIF